jgi:superoxide dismutase
MNFKEWPGGMHHHAEHLQVYIDEYTSRCNRSSMKGYILKTIIRRMMEPKHCTCETIINKRQTEHAKHRCFENFIDNMFFALIA